MSESVRLNLGCGDKILEGYVNVDIAEARREMKPDVICDVRKLDRFGNDDADEILAVHLIEHFYLWEVQDILREWKRVLKPGGRLVIECPDLMKAIFHILSNPSHEQLGMWALYGNPHERDELMCHRWGYSSESLVHQLREAGFVEFRQESAQFKLGDLRDMRIVSFKPPVTVQYDTNMM